MVCETIAILKKLIENPSLYQCHVVNNKGIYPEGVLNYEEWFVDFNINESPSYIPTAEIDGHKIVGSHDDNIRLLYNKGKYSIKWWSRDNDNNVINYIDENCYNQIYTLFEKLYKSNETSTYHKFYNFAYEC